MKEAERIQVVQTPIIPIVSKWIQETPGTISLGQGVVHYGPPSQAIDRLNQSLQDSNIHIYQEVEGIEPLLRLIEKKLKEENQILLNSHSQAVVTAGSNMGFLNTILAITNPGDEIILQTPYYFNHEMAITIASCKPVLVPTDTQYQLQPDKIREAITNRTKAVVTVSPNNPTGAVYSQEALEEVNKICKAAHVYHISDEAYEYFTYEGTPHFSPGSIEDAGEHTISLYSLSKAYGFASWRIGYMVIPKHLGVAMNKIQDTNLICPPVVCQYAAVGALEMGVKYCLEYLKPLAEVRNLVVEELGQLGDQVQIPKTQGAFYVFIKVKNADDPMELTRRLIQENQVAVVPGIAFGMEEGCYLRVAFGALERNTVAEGIGRLVKGLQKL